MNVDYVINPLVWERAEQAAREEFDRDLRHMGFSEEAIVVLHKVAKDRDVAPGTLLRQAVLNAIGLQED